MKKIYGVLCWEDDMFEDVEKTFLTLEKAIAYQQQREKDKDVEEFGLEFTIREFTLED